MVDTDMVGGDASSLLFEGHFKAVLHFTLILN